MFDRNTRFEIRVEYADRVVGFARRALFKQFVESVHADETELVADLIVRDDAVAERRNLIEKRIRVADRAGRLSCNPIERFVVGLDRQFTYRIGKQILYLFCGNETEIELLTTAFDRSRNFLQLRRRKNKDDVGRRFFDRF